MSGGSMDYLGYKVKDATFREDTPERRALRKHLNKLSKALIAIEWNDSGDGADNESELIREALGDAAILEAAVQHAREAHKELGAELARVEASWLSKEMRTPAKGFPAIKETLKVGDIVELPADLPECRGLLLRGLLISFPRHGDSEVLLELDLPDTPRRQFIHVPTYRLVKVPE